MSYQIVYQNPVSLFDAWPDAPEGWFDEPPRRGGPEWIDAAKERGFATAVADKPAKAVFLDLALVVDLPWEQTGRYVHCQLHCDVMEPFDFSAPLVVCFQVVHQRRVQRVRVALPGGVMGAPRVRFKLFPFPYCEGGRYFVQSMRLVEEEDQHAEPSRRAMLDALKQSVFQSAERSELEGAPVVHHYPNSITLELTPRCNLTCSHCSSHGDGESHLRYNKMPELSVEHLERMAEEVFDSVTEISLVGRGEPMMVSPALWDALVRRVRHHRILLGITTNGLFVKRRLPQDLLPHLGMVQFSIDGGSEETVRVNRGGASLEEILENLAHFDRMRREADLLRRPRLSISWTMKRNNVRELAGFIRRMLQYDVDYYYLRHLMIWNASERSQSLLEGDPSDIRLVREAYAVLEEHGITTDAPPLPAESPVERGASQAASPPPPPAAKPPDRCLYIHRNAVVWAGGDVLSCVMSGSKVTGNLGQAETFWDLWNGEVMQDVRSTFGTPREWAICKGCWYRASRFQTLRDEARGGNAQTLVREEALDEKMWDFSGQRR